MDAAWIGRWVLSQGKRCMREIESVLRRAPALGIGLASLHGYEKR